MFSVVSPARFNKDPGPKDESNSPTRAKVAGPLIYVLATCNLCLSHTTRCATRPTTSGVVYCTRATSSIWHTARGADLLLDIAFTSVLLIGRG